MKIKTLSFLVSMALLSLASCADEGKEQLLQGKEIKLGSEIIPASRVLGQSVQSTQIVEGQQLGITITGAQEEHDNKAWTAMGNGGLNYSGDKVTWGNTDITVVAYHPYNAGWTGDKHSFSVKTDQSTEEGYLASDLLWATAEASPSDVWIPLKFTHKLARISVTLTSDDIDDLSGAEVYICATMVSKYFNPKTGELGDFSGVSEQIKAGSITKDNPTVSAIIIPQHVNAAVGVIKIVYAGKEYRYYLTRNIQYMSGYSYHYTLKIFGGDSSEVEEVISGGVEDMDIVEW